MGMKKHIAALVLAAGYSSRMGDLKSLLTLGGLTVIEQVILTLQKAGIADIRVVLGYRGNELIPILERLGVTYILNEEYDRGMFSSIVKGVASFSPETEGFFLLPGDMPLVKSHTIRLLNRSFHKGDVIYPVFQGKRGHPPLISKKCFPTILSGEEAGGLRFILEEKIKNTYEVEVLDEGILIDLDTREEYQMVHTMYYPRNIPTQAECNELLARMKVPSPIVNHGRVVADISRKLAIGLNQVGLNLDVNAVVAAGTLHDLAKGKPDHARMGARALKKCGYLKVAQIVASHTDLILEDGVLPDEAAVVYLADKLVKGDNIVSLHERFSSAMMKYMDNGEAIAAIQERRLRAEKVEEQIELLLGVRIETMINDPCYL